MPLALKQRPAVELDKRSAGSVLTTLAETMSRSCALKQWMNERPRGRYRRHQRKGCGALAIRQLQVMNTG